MTDVDDIVKYCADINVSKWITQMPHPYKKKDAVWWIKDSAKKWKQKTDYIYVIEYEGKLAGAVGLHIKGDDKGELGYWLGKPFWGKGLMTEAAKLLMKEAFKRLKMNKVYARFMEGNKASERVQQKLGMKYECWLHDDIKKNGKYLNAGQYYILRSQFKP